MSPNHHASSATLLQLRTNQRQAQRFDLLAASASRRASVAQAHSGNTPSPDACGFDFGTSNTSIAQFIGNKPQLIDLQDGKTSVPTAVFFNYDDGQTYFGRRAVRRYLDYDEGRLLRSLKSLLGSSLYDETTYIRAKRIEFAEIITLFIAFGRAATANASGTNAATKVVMGRPVHFVDDDAEADARAEQQLRAAAVQAGFEHVEFQFEPIAAALDYEQSVTREEIALVIDIGGGTSDFSIVRVSPERARQVNRKDDILSYSGVHIGGTDFDRLLSLKTLMPFLGFKSKMLHGNMNPPSWYYHDLSTWQRINVLYDGKVITDITRVRHESAEPDKLTRLLKVLELKQGHELLGQVEDTKIQLSSELDVALASVAFDRGQRLKVTRKQFEAAVHDAMQKIGAKIADTIKLARLPTAAINTVFLTGGSSGIPMLRTMIEKALPAAKIIEGDAFGSVATGLAIEARRKFG
jgi:hypothetical chaperone protein